MGIHRWIPLASGLPASAFFNPRRHISESVPNKVTMAKGLDFIYCSQASRIQRDLALSSVPDAGKGVIKNQSFSLLLIQSGAQQSLSFKK